jgi:hypothetical protein
VTLRHWSSGFVASGGAVLVAAESVEPWMFDTDIAEAIAAREVSILPSSVNIIVTTVPAGTRPSQQFSSLRGEVRVAKKRAATQTVVSASTRRRFRVRFRANDANAALLELRGWTGPALPEAQQPIGWQVATVAIPRWQNGRVEAELLDASIQPDDDGRYQLRDAIDAAAFGSPVWIEGGVIGLLQDENSAAAMATVMRRLK